MQIAAWHPFQEMENFFRQDSPRFDLSSDGLFDKGGHNIAEWSPSADISETKTEEFPI